MPSKNLVLILLAGLLGIATIGAADEPAATQPTVQQGAPLLVDAADAAAVSAAMDMDVFLEGTIASAEWSDSGKLMRASFKNGANRLQVIVFEKKRAAFDAAFAGDVCKALIGARCRFSGHLKNYKGSGEVILDRVSQITIYDPAPDAVHRDGGRQMTR